MAGEIVRLVLFREEWLQWHGENSEQFPVEMEPGDWDESFDIYEVDPEEVTEE